MLSLRWKFQTPGPVTAWPAVVNNVVYIGSADGHLYALEAQTGTPKWQTQFNGPVTSPAVVSGLVYFGADQLYAVEAQTGRTRWQLRLSGSPTGAVSVGGGVVVLGAQGGPLYGVDANRGDVRWQFSPPHKQAAYRASLGAQVYVGARDPYLYVLDWV